MTSAALGFPTTYIYTPLRGPRYIRLLECTTDPVEQNFSEELTYSLVQYEIPISDTTSTFEAISYTWGKHERVSALPIRNSIGQIGLTANLTEALPHMTSESHTKRLWIDQLCINQADNDEKAVQIGLMAEIYRRAKRVIVWLGSEDDNTQVCAQWLCEIDKVISTLDCADRITPGHVGYIADVRALFLRKTFDDPVTDPIFAPAIQAFWRRPYFRRGWICQEFLLGQDLVCLAGSMSFTFQNLVDLFSVPDAAQRDDWVSHRFLMSVKLYPLTSAPPLNFLRLLAAVASEFQTQEIVDRLFGCLGLMEGLDFKPDYALSVKKNFTRFAVTLARDYGSLDFLSLWAANLDPLVPNTPDELQGFASWVPSWTAIPLYTPWRLATGGATQYRNTILWNAATGRKHVHDQLEDAMATERLHVRGKMVDRIDAMSSTKFTKYLDGVDDAYLCSLVDQIKTDVPGLDHWTHVDLIRFLNKVTANGGDPERSAEDLLVPATLQNEVNTFRNMSHANEGLGLALAMGRGRRFVRTEKGRLGLVPAIGTQARCGETKGSAIFVLHGCIVPVVLEIVDQDRGRWKLVGDCYVEGVMRGEAVNWDENDTESLQLV
jgi:hypothetical protein